VASLIYLDTHVAAWLFEGRTDKFPAKLRQEIEDNDLLISPAVVLELQYLFEIRRVTEPAVSVVEALEREIGLRVCDLPFASVIQVALGQSWTRDPFDRVLVAHAALREAPLMTKDELIRSRYPRAFWLD
jgi:PIN domain nuclease of toxin-antitoxin system